MTTRPLELRRCAAPFLIAAMLLACQPSDGAPGGEAAGAASGTGAAVSESDELMYFLGTMSAQTFDPLGLSEQEAAAVLRGLSDALAGNAAELNPDRDYARELQELMQNRVAAAAQAEADASAAFLAEAAAAEGAVVTDSGLVFTVTQPGDGPKPEYTDTVTVHYHGTLRDGTVFDSSIERGSVASFPLTRVIRCWTEGIPMMNTGSKATLTCPADIAYGDRGSPPKIPGGAVLQFEVELIKFTSPES